MGQLNKELILLKSRSTQSTALSAENQGKTEPLRSPAFLAALKAVAEHEGDKPAKKRPKRRK